MLKKSGIPRIGIITAPYSVPPGSKMDTSKRKVRCHTLG